MKRFYAWLFGCAVVSGLATNLVASDFSTGGIHYDIIPGPENSLTVVRPTDGTYLASHITIPAILTFNQKEYTVTQIADSAFINSLSLESMTIPGTVQSIGTDAFLGCGTLTSLTFTSEGLDTTDQYTSLSTLPNWTSTNHSNSSQSQKEYTLFAVAGSSLSFSYDVDSESKYDFFRAYIDGNSILESSGHQSGSKSYVFNSSGTYTLKFQYTKDSSQSSGQDRVTVSEILLTNIECTEATVITTRGAKDLLLAENTFSDCPLANLSLGRPLSFSNGSPFAGKSTLATLSFTDGCHAIVPNLFRDCTALTSLSIPQSIKHIDTNAFSNCTALETLRFEASDSTIFIANEVFSGTPLKNLYIGRNWRAPGALATTLEHVTFGDKVTTIPDNAFAGCENISRIVIPDSVTTIGSYAFSENTALNNLSLGSSLKIIGRNAFMDCTALTTVILPPSMETADNAFNGCTGLLKSAYPSQLSNPIPYGFTVPYTASYLISENGIIYNEDRSQVIFVPISYSGDYSTPETVSKIGENAFGHCISLKSITIGENIVFIGTRAFQSCDSLETLIFNAINCTYSGSKDAPAFPGEIKNISIGQKVKSIPPYFLYNGNNAEQINLPDSIESIGQYAFYSNSRLENLVLPDNLVSIGEYAFAKNSSLKDITFGNKLKTLGNYSFFSCKSLKSVVLPPSVSSIGNRTFYDCSALEKSAYPSKLGNPYQSGISIAYESDALLSDNGIIYNGDKSAVIFVPLGFEGDCSLPSSVKSIGQYAFGLCKSLKSVTIPEAVERIENEAFASCDSLNVLNFNAINCIYCGSDYYPAFPSKIKKVRIGHSVTNIPDYFLFAGNLAERIELPNATTTIGFYAFRDSRDLKSFTFGTSLQTIKEGAFYSTSLVKAIWLGNTAPKGTEYVSANINYVSNDQYPYDQSKVRKYQFLSSKFTVDGTVYVPVSASERTCDAIDCLYDPDIRTVTIPRQVSNRNVAFNVLSVNPYTYYSNPYISMATMLNDGSIGEYAFNNCQALDSIVVRNIGDIEASIFARCTNLKKAVIECTGGIGDRAFENLILLSQVTFGDKIDDIGAYSFNGCKNLSSISVPDSVSFLGEGAFQNCSSLGTVNLGNRLKLIRPYVFNGCSCLKEIRIPNSVTNIGSFAFQGCTQLSDITFMDALNEEDQIENEKNFVGEDWVSTNTKDSSVSSHEWLFDVAAGDKLIFDWFVDSERNYDFLKVYINSTPVIKQSGNSLSGNYSTTFEFPGTVIIRAEYSKDGSVSSNGDKAMITNMRVSGEGFVHAGLYLGSNGPEPMFKDCPLDEVYIGRRLYYSTKSSNGYSPFYRNTSLRSVEISDKEVRIYDNEFYGCSNLHTLTIGNGVTNIGNWAFSGCSSLDYFSAGYNVNSIGEEAFSDCTGLKNYYSFSLVPPICGTQALDDINKWDCTLHVPAEKRDVYMGASQWKEFFYMEEMEGVPVIEIRLNVSMLNINVGDTFTFVAEILPTNATDKSVIWSIDNPEIASISTTGLLTVLSEGKTIVRATSTDGNVFAECEVNTIPETGIVDVEYDDMLLPIEVYDINGIKVADSLENLKPGFYIVRKGSQISKIRI